MAVNAKNDAMAGLLRQTLAQPSAAGASAEQCPDAEILAAYYDRSLSAEDTARLDVHFSQCASCREQLALLAQSDSRSDESSDENRAPAREHGQQDWMWDWRWLAATAALLAVITYWGLRKPVNLARERNAPIVAMTQPPQQPSQQQRPAAQTVPQPPARQSKTLSAPAPIAPNAPSDNASTPGAETSNAKSKVQTPLANSLATKETASRDLPLNGRNYSNFTLIPRSTNAPAASSNASSAADAIAPSAKDSQPAQRRESDNAAAAAVAAPKPQIAVSAEAAPATAATEAARAKAEPAAPAAFASGTAANENVKRQAAPVRTYGALQAANAQKRTESGAFFVVKTPDANTLWRVQGGLMVEISHDGGASWQPHSLPATSEILAGSAPSVKVLWVVDRNGMVLVTTDGGASWKPLTPPGASPLTAISAASATNATVTAANGRRFSTIDGGKTWTPLP